MSRPATIGGLDAHLFVGRRIKVHSKQGSQHGTPAKLVSLVNGKRALVHPEGHKGTDTVDIDTIWPWWSQNPDLQEKLKDLDIIPNIPAIPSVERLSGEGALPGEPAVKPQPEKPTVPVEVVAVAPPPPPAPPVIEAPPVVIPPAPPVAEVPPPVIARQPLKPATPPKMVIHQMTTEWLPVYQDYLVLLAQERDDLALLDELQRTLEINRTRQQEAVTRLGELGVEIIQDERPAEQHVETHVDQQSNSASNGGPRRQRSLEVMQAIDDWCAARRAELDANPHAQITGTMNAFASAAGIQMTSFVGYIDDMTEKHGIVLVSEDGQGSGSKARGKLSVKLA